MSKTSKTNTPATVTPNGLTVFRPVNELRTREDITLAVAEAFTFYSQIKGAFIGWLRRVLDYTLSEILKEELVLEPEKVFEPLGLDPVTDQRPMTENLLIEFKYSGRGGLVYIRDLHSEIFDRVTEIVDLSKAEVSNVYKITAPQKWLASKYVEAYNAADTDTRCRWCKVKTLAERDAERAAERMKKQQEEATLLALKAKEAAALTKLKEAQAAEAEAQKLKKEGKAEAAQALKEAQKAKELAQKAKEAAVAEIHAMENPSDTANRDKRKVWKAGEAQTYPAPTGFIKVLAEIDSTSDHDKQICYVIRCVSDLLVTVEDGGEYSISSVLKEAQKLLADR